MNQFSDAACFHSSAWLRVLRDTYGHRAVGFLKTDGDRVSGLVPFVEISSPLTGRRGVCSAFADYCPPLVGEQATFEELREKFLPHARHRRWNTVEVRGGREWFSNAPASTSFLAHELDLSADLDKLFQGLDAAVRRNIRRAEREGVRVEILTSAEAMKAYYTLHCATRRRLGSPPQPLRFFAAITQHFLLCGSGFVALACHKDRPIAGIVVLQFGKNAIYKFGASDEAHLHLRGNNLVMWKSIEHCASQGLKHYHFGRTSLGDEGLRRFKSGWGTRECHLDYFRYDLSRERFVAAPDRTNAWPNRIVSRLPLRLVRWLGACLYPHLS